jgi:hypothetical protein
MKVEENTMRKKRTHLYKITREEAAAALDILNRQSDIIERLKCLLEIRTSKKRRIGLGFRNDIEMIIDAAK